MIVCESSFHSLCLLEDSVLGDRGLAPDLSLIVDVVRSQLEVCLLLLLVVVTGIVITFMKYWLLP